MFFKNDKYRIFSSTEKAANNLFRGIQLACKQINSWVIAINANYKCDINPDSLLNYVKVSLFWIFSFVLILKHIHTNAYTIHIRTKWKHADDMSTLKMFQHTRLRCVEFTFCNHLLWKYFESVIWENLLTKNPKNPPFFNIQYSFFHLFSLRRKLKIVIVNCNFVNAIINYFTSQLIFMFVS